MNVKTEDLHNKKAKIVFIEMKRSCLTLTNLQTQTFHFESFDLKNLIWKFFFVVTAKITRVSFVIACWWLFSSFYQQAKYKFHSEKEKSGAECFSTATQGQNMNKGEEMKRRHTNHFSQCENIMENCALIMQEVDSSHLASFSVQRWQKIWKICEDVNSFGWMVIEFNV